MPDEAFFASRTLTIHLLRGVVGLVAFGLPLHFNLSDWRPMAASFAVMLLAWKGCPRCWCRGLACTLNHGARQRLKAADAPSKTPASGR